MDTVQQETVFEDKFFDKTGAPAKLPAERWSAFRETLRQRALGAYRYGRRHAHAHPERSAAIAFGAGLTLGLALGALAASGRR